LDDGHPEKGILTFVLSQQFSYAATGLPVLLSVTIKLKHFTQENAVDLQSVGKVP
jgi:hypothetical protein